MSILDIKDLEIQFQTDDGCAKAVNKVNLSLEEGDTLAWWEKPEPERRQRPLALCG